MLAVSTAVISLCFRDGFRSGFRHRLLKDILICLIIFNTDRILEDIALLVISPSFFEVKKIRMS